MKNLKRILSSMLIICLLVGMIPASAIPAFGAEDADLTAALAEAKTYTDAITINNTSNDPATVVKTFKTHFTWDNEKRENSKGYLYDWSYYNGVVFEGLEYLYEVTGEEAYKDYVVEYMSSLIDADGTWAKCTNSGYTSKVCAGYNSTHGADCYKTASLLLDAYEMTKDERYLKIAETLYADLDTAAKTYSLSNAGGNYRHTWAEDPAQDLWLDGLYMILPFRAEYAKHTGDTEELDLIVDRMQWVSDNMYNEDKGLFYHAANSASDNSGTYWLRSIGWYAAAIVDIMDSMEGENLEAMKKQLVKLVDGMKACQNEENGMWLNNMAASNSSTNPYETSGTALTCYAVMKAVNEGWLDASYADMAILAFKGICEEKLEGTTLNDICFKGAPGSSNSTFYSNEGKGVGPFIMFYAEVQEYVNNQKTETPEEPENTEVTVDDVTISVEGVTDLAGAAVTEADKTLIEAKTYDNFVAYDITATLTGEKATVSIPVPSEWNATAEELVGISVEAGEVKEIKGTYADGLYTFEVGHFSAKGVAYTAKAAEDEITNSGTGNLVGGNVYTLATKGVTAGEKYLIVNTNSGSGYALTNNGANTPGRTSVNITDGKIIVEDDSNIAWQFSGSTSGTVGNNGRYVYPSNGSLSLNTNSANMTINSQGSGAYRIYRRSSNSNRYYYLTYGTSWTGSTTASNVYLYEFETSSVGETVTFTVTPETATIAPEGTANLTGTVTVAGETVDLSNCTIKWDSSDTTKANVSDGTVTGVADGTANITATLSAVNGTALQKDITLTIPVTVQSKTVVSGELTGNDPVTTSQNVEPDFSNIKLTVTYDDETTGVITVANGLVIEGYDITVIGYTYATISYNGEVYGTVRVTVEGNPYAGLEEATTYPEYPEDGAVRIDKTATEVDFENTGVVQVELDVAGITVKKAVDVVLVVDVSNSMGWSLENAGNSADADKLPDAGQKTKLDIAMQSASDFADILLEDNTGSVNDNTLSFVTFAGYDSTFGKDNRDSKVVDSLMEVFRGVTSPADAKMSFANTEFTEATTAYPLKIADTKGEAIVSGNNRGDTNYDYAFWQTAQTIEAIKADNAAKGQENRDVYVVFMTDGAPSHYNNETRNGSSGRADLIPESTTQYYNQSDSYTQDGWYNYFSTNANIYAKEVYDLVDGNFVGIGFDLAHGGFGSWSWTEVELAASLRQVAHDDKEVDVLTTNKESELNGYYRDIAHKIKFAGTQANVTDVIDGDFDLQLTQTTGSADATINGNLGFKPTITVSTYELWTKEETSDNSLIGTRKVDAEGNEIRTPLETVSFNDDGTEAYSTLKEGNILSAGQDGTVTIDAFYFTYVKTRDGEETFKWSIGNITDQEIVLSFYAYLSGALEGERPKQLYYTNENATLEYIDINGDHATQTFPVPAVAWGGASTSYEFYLVNEAGEPCDRDGNVIPFANRIIITGPFYEELYLNQEDENYAKEIIAAYVLPAGYVLYDETAKYTVTTASGDIGGSLKISDPAEGKEQTTVLVSATKPSYVQSRVAFGVNFKSIPSEAEFEMTPNEVVIDYGKNILIETNDNETLEDGFKATLVGFSKYYDSVDMNHKFSSTSAIDDFKASYGTFSIEDGAKRTVRYTPTGFVNGVEKVFCVLKMYNETSHDTYYMVDLLTVIPATNVYYETDFAADVFATKTTGTPWSTKTGGSAADNLQDDGTIGVNQTYGYDSSYKDDNLLSNGSSLFVEGAGVKSTTSEFTFTGTGFDLISRTGEMQGAIRVDIYTDAARTADNRVKSVTVLNKSESKLELYQIPVVSVNDLAYGTYYVTVGVNAAYDDPDFDVLDRGGEFYFDAVRVYDPAKGNAEAEEAYALDGEAAPVITEVRGLLIAAGDFDVTTTNPGVTFIDRTQSGVDVATYETIGPNNEVYLSNGQGIAFEVSATSDIASIDIAAKAPNNDAAATLTANISAATDDNGTGIVKEITSATPQYFNIMEGSDTDLATIFAYGKAYVVIRNTGEGVLSITDIKVAYESTKSNSARTVAYTVSEDTIVFANTVEKSSISEEPNYDIISAEFTDETCRLFSEATLKVVTTQDVDSLELRGVFALNAYPEIESITINEDGNLVWTVKIKMVILGNKTYRVTGYSEDGEAGESASASIRVKLF